MIRLNVFIHVSAENRASMLAEAKAMVEKSLKDSGCISYDVYESATRPNELMICETWYDDKALDAHSATPHFAQHVGNMKKLGRLKTERFSLIPLISHF